MRLLPWKNQANHSFGHQFIQVYIQPGFLLRAQAGQFRPDGLGIVEVQMVVVLWVLDPPDICLDGCKLVLPRQQMVQKGALCGFINCIPKLAFG